LKLQPLDWNFSTCPKEELPILYCYEFSRESISLRDAIEHMRRGKPGFGWPEWPEQPFLSIPARKRQKRLTRLLTPDPLSDIIEAIATQPEDASELDLQIAIAVHVREQATQKKDEPRNRGAATARYRDQLKALSVYRLRRHHSARKIISLLQETYRKMTYNDDASASVYKAAKRAEQHLDAFALRAHSQILAQRWFPPFGWHLIKP
jgi:hypothetical protein